MNIEVGAAGKLGLGIPQQRWHQKDDPLLQIARFAGQEMMVITDDKGCFDLHYLGFEVKGFQSMDEARAAAPTLARHVLGRMSSLISG